MWPLLHTLSGSTATRIVRVGALLVALTLSLGWVGAGRAEPIAVTLDHYFAFVGAADHQFFTGKFLTGEDLQDEQDYQRLGPVISRYIGETEKNLAQFFSRAEELDVIVLFDEADALFGKRTDVPDARARFDDFIIVDETTHRWRGQLVLSGVDELPPGAYDLTGTFGRVSVPEPASIVLLVAGLGAFLTWRNRRFL
jgi:hypothetical protein